MYARSNNKYMIYKRCSGVHFVTTIIFIDVRVYGNFLLFLASLNLQQLDYQSLKRNKVKFNVSYFRQNATN